MNQFNKAQVIMLPTDKETNIVLNPTSKKLLLTKDWGHHDHSNKPIKNFIDIGFIPQHLYIISDDEIKEGDCVISTYDNWKNISSLKPQIGKILKITKDYILIDSFNGDKDNKWDHGHCKKIIATTDNSLKIFGGKGDICDLYYNLPQPSQQFINLFIEFYNKGEVITDILVGYEYFSNKGNIYGNPMMMSVEQSKLKLKINPDNTITIKPTKDSWNREEMVENMWRAYKEADTIFVEEAGLRHEFDRWITKIL